MYIYLIPIFIWYYSKISKFVDILTSFALLIQGFKLTITRVKNGILVVMKRYPFFIYPWFRISLHSSKVFYDIIYYLKRKQTISIMERRMILTNVVKVGFLGGWNTPRNSWTVHQSKASCLKWALTSWTSEVSQGWVIQD